MTTFDARTEVYLARLLAEAPPLTSEQVDLLRRTYGHAETAPDSELDAATADLLPEG